MVWTLRWSQFNDLKLRTVHMIHMYRTSAHCTKIEFDFAEDMFEQNIHFANNVAYNSYPARYVPHTCFFWDSKASILLNTAYMVHVPPIHAPFTVANLSLEGVRVRVFITRMNFFYGMFLRILPCTVCTYPYCTFSVNPLHKSLNQRKTLSLY